MPNGPIKIIDNWLDTELINHLSERFLYHYPHHFVEKSLNTKPIMYSYDFTPGDVMGMLGTKISGMGPLMTTIANRMGDTPNINAFLNYVLIFGHYGFSPMGIEGAAPGTVLSSSSYCLAPPPSSIRSPLR